MSAQRKIEVVLIGAGNMGLAMLKGWLRALRATHRFHAVDPHAPSALAELRTQTDCSLVHYGKLADLPVNLRADIIVLATKPQSLLSVLPDLPKSILDHAIVVSIAAGVGISDIQRRLEEHTSVVRVMPNIGAQVGYAASAGFADAKSSSAVRKRVEDLFSAIGAFVWLDDEEQLHAATALSGSGPAYIFAMCEAMIAAGIAQGLSETVARTLAVSTMSSAGRLLEDSPHPALLRETVTSPNGTTAAGLTTLGKNDALNRLIGATLDAAARRSIELQ